MRRSGATVIAPTVEVAALGRAVQAVEEGLGHKPRAAQDQGNADYETDQLLIPESLAAIAVEPVGQERERNEPGAQHQQDGTGQLRGGPGVLLGTHWTVPRTAGRCWNRVTHS